jgi:hypothetical protein
LVASIQVLQPKQFRFSSRLAAVWSHLRFGLQNLFQIAMLAGLLAGGNWIWIAFLAVAATINIGNALLPLDFEEPENPPRALHDFFLRLGLPLMLANGLLLVHYFTDGDPLRVVAGLHRVGIDFEAARAATSAFDKGIAIIAVSLLWVLGQSNGHELSHRIHSPLDLVFSKWTTALALDPAHGLHHPFSHHRLVGLPSDAGTARRGESLYAFTLRSFVAINGYAAKAEAARLQRRGGHWLSIHNRLLTAWAISLFYLAGAVVIGGLPSALAFLAAAGLAHLMFEGITYIQHYGLFRVEGERIDERISWDVYGAISSAATYNVNRHSDHHLHPMRHCADLKVSPGAPNLPYAYSALTTMAMIPPLYRRVMQPYLDNWDRNFATPAELAYMREHDIPHAEPAVILRAA